MKFSPLFRLNFPDFLHGLYVAVAGAVCGFLLTRMTAGVFTFDWTTIWHTSATAAISYLNLRFFSGEPKTIEIDPAKTQILQK